MATTTAKKKKSDKTLKDLFMGELADIYYSENRLVKALPKMAKAAKAEELKEAINSHLEETEGHVETLKAVFEAFDATAKGKKCESMAGLLKEGDEISSEFKGSHAGDAAIISACQKVEHYEIATYGCLCEWANLLGNTEAAALLEEILEEEKAADETLTELARAASNEEALA